MLLEDWGPGMEDGYVAPGMDSGGPPHLGAVRASAPRALPVIDLPCSMLVRDLPSVATGDWTPHRSGLILVAPKGSTAFIQTPGEHVPDTLHRAGPKVLQIFAVLIQRWRAQAPARRPDAPLQVSTGSIAADILRGRVSSRERQEVAAIIDCLSRISFLSGPSGHRNTPDPPIRLHGGDDDTLTVSLGASWVRELCGTGSRAAKLPLRALSLHARNDRYTILLAWYLSIMLRVNRKHGFRYRASLARVLEGAGIQVPDRNVGRFLRAIYHALDAVPGVRWAGPSHTLYASSELLDAKFTFATEPELLLAYIGNSAISPDEHAVAVECAIPPQQTPPTAAGRARESSPPASTFR